MTFLHPWRLPGVSSLKPVEVDDDVSGGTTIHANKGIIRSVKYNVIIILYDIMRISENRSITRKYEDY